MTTDREREAAISAVAAALAEFYATADSFDLTLVAAVAVDALIAAGVVGDSEQPTTRNDESASGERPHIGLNGGRCNFCGVRIDNASRGRTCSEASTKEQR